MPFINWIPAYDIGNSVIDGQHRQLAHLANLLHDAAVSGEIGQTLGFALKELVEYVHVHFAAEEELAATHAPDEFPLQRAAHLRWIAKLRDVVCVSGTDPRRASLELTTVVETFLLKHVLGMDVRLASYLPPEAGEVATELKSA